MDEDTWKELNELNDGLDIVVMATDRAIVNMQRINDEN